MSTSAIKFDVVENDILLTCTGKMWDYGTSTIKIPNSGTNLFWTVCTVNPATLSIEYDPTATFDYTMIHTYFDLPLTGINLVNNKQFGMMLYPTVDSISPFLNSNNTSLQIYSKAGIGTSSVYNQRRFQLDNYSNLYLDNTGLIVSGGTLGATSSGVLSGIWASPTYADLSSVANISGVVVYDAPNAGYIWVDLHNIPNSAFQTGLSTVYIKYSANYDTQLNTFAPYISNATLQMELTNNDTKSFVISCYTDVGSVTAGTLYYYPPSIRSIEQVYDYSTATLSAVQYKNGQTGSFLLSVTSLWPTDYLRGRAISWRGSSDTLNPANMKLSAILPKAGNAIYDISNITMSGWSVSADYVQLTSTSQYAQTFSISSFFAEAESNTTQRVPYVYTFKYNPIISEDLVINTISHTLTSEIIQVQRKVVGLGSTELSPVLHPLVWGETSTFGSLITACTGLDSTDWNNTTNYVCTTGIALTGYTGLVGVDTYGVDYLNVKYFNNTDNVYTIHVGYSGTPFYNSSAAFDTHTFQVYSAPSAVVISAVGFDNESFTRSLTARLIKDTGATIHPSNIVKWSIPQTLSGDFTIYNTDGTLYNTNNYTTDTIIVKLSTDTFTTFAENVTFNLFASTYNAYTNPSLPAYLVSATKPIIVDTFPSESLYSIDLMANYESSLLVSDMYRDVNPAYSLTAKDMSTFAGTIVSGTRVIDFGDGRTTNSQVTSVIFNASTPSISTVRLTRSGVSASNWLSAHTFETDINLHFISQFLSADFIAYPTYVFTSSSTQVINSDTTLLATNGVSSYNHGHNEPFILSAHDITASTYVWSVDGNVRPQNLPTITYSTTESTSGSPITLKLHNSELPLAMPETYLSDFDGSVKKYPNFKTTDNSTALFQDLKMLPYENPILKINTDLNEIIITTDYTLSATSTVVYPAWTPLLEGTNSSTWVLSTLKWAITGTDNDFSTKLSVGYSGDITGVLKYGSTTPLILNFYRTSYTTIPNSFAGEWQVAVVSGVTSVNIDYQVAPALSFTPRHRYALTGEDIYIFNNTLSSSFVTAFDFFDGLSSYYHRTDYNDFAISAYPIDGTFNFAITGYITNGQTYENTINNALTILPEFQAFDPTVTRVFGTTELALPNSLEKVKIPINEWSIAENFNNSITLLNENYEYLIAMTKYYSLPPIDFVGWLGSRYEDTFVKFGWNIFGYPNYQEEATSLNNATLSATNDVVCRNDILYVADTNKVELFDLRLNPPLLNTITKKTIDDSIGFAKAIDVDSTNRIYVLDQTKNRILVFAAYNPSDLNTNKFLYEWGGLGGPNSKSKFNNPNDLFIDNTDTVWIADTGNKAIKKYTRTGSWLQTILPNEIMGDSINTGGIISIAIDSNNIVHVLTSTKVFKYTYEGVFVESYVVFNPNNEVPVKIDNMYNSGFLYICFPTYVIKVQENGVFAGIIGTEIADANFNSIYHDSNYALYVTNTKNVLQYFETNVINTSLDTKLYDVKWSLPDLLVDKNEYIQDWVCNVTFKRFWDNIELYRRCLLGKVSYVTDDRGISQIIITDYTPSEYASMYLPPKEDIFVGINELVTADVVNRCITQLYNTLNLLVPHI